MKATDRWDCHADELDFELALLSQSNPPVHFQSPPPMTEILAACLSLASSRDKFAHSARRRGRSATEYGRLRLRNPDCMYVGSNGGPFQRDLVEESSNLTFVYALY
jgi:hypothetical protein